MIGSKAIIDRGLPSLLAIQLNPYAPVAKWVLATSGLVASMVHIGGVTRLTRSGLSMTDWTPLGSFPPITHEQWLVEFDKYKAFPEWQQRQCESFYFFTYHHPSLKNHTPFLIVVCIHLLFIRVQI